MTIRPVRLVAGDAAATVQPGAGGRVGSLLVGRHELLVADGRDVFHWGSFPLAPWVGRLRHGRLVLDGETVQLPVNAPPHALHGLVTDRPWSVLDVDERSVSLAVDLGNTAGSRDPWPWPCRITQTITLAEQSMEFRLAVHADGPMPADIGWHPWFVRSLQAAGRSVAAQLQVAGGQIYLNDDEDIPTGELGPPPAPPWDYCFVGLEQPPVIRWPGLLAVTVESDCDHWVLYDMEEPGICVEPWTGPPNSLNGPAPRVVTSDRPRTAWMGWHWRLEE